MTRVNRKPTEKWPPPPAIDPRGRCAPGHHSYALSGQTYMKYSKTGEKTLVGQPIYDQTILYARLFCTACGDQKEIIAMDHRAQGSAS